MASYIGGVPHMFFKDASHRNKEEPSSTKYIPVIVDIMPALARLWPKPTDTTSTSLQHMQMQRISSRSVMDVGAMRSKITCRLKNSG